MKKLILMALLLISSMANSQINELYELSEDNLLKLSKETVVPQLDEIQAVLLEAKSQDLQANDNLGANLYGSYNYSQTKEKGLIVFQPVFSPVNQYKLGVKKNFKYGLQADAYTSVDRRSNEVGTYSNLTSVTYGLQLNIDLWKDAFGRLTRKELENVEVARKKAEIENQISKKVFTVSLRRIYWSLVANKEKMNISKSLLQTAIQQRDDALKRKASSVADASEVARYESQVASREGSILYLKYERENLLKNLRNFIPALSSKEVELAKYSLDKTIFEVLSCTATIDKEKTVPYQYTQYDELTTLIKKVQQNQEKLDESYDAVDVKLLAEFKATGVGSSSTDNTNFSGSQSQAMDDLNDNDRSGFAAGIMVNIPIGKKINDTSEVTKKYHQKKLKAGIVNVENNLVSTHKQISKSIQILGDVIKAQKVNSKQLSIRLKEMKKKYNQARIPVYALVQDQDALLSSDLSIVDTQLAILNTILDYFVIFDQTPCGFNKL